MTDRRIQTKRITISGRRKTDLAQESVNQHFADEIEALKKNDGDAKEQMARNHEEITTLLTPISETYKTVTRLGKWGMAITVFVSILIGIITGLKNILHK